MDNRGELTVNLYNGEVGDGGEWFNLADLIVLARLADLSVIPVHD
jgi:hypothetical protein